jgi:hypothetical protein
MPRRVYRLGVGITLGALALAFTDWALRLRPGVTEANARRIREGMALTDVEGLFGRPPDRRTGGGHCPTEICQWRTPGGGATVELRNGRVREVDWYERQPPSPFARLRAWLGW